MKIDYFKNYKFFKVIQLALLIIFGITFFYYLYFDPSLKNNVYTNKNLLTICVFLWAFMVYSLITIIWDFHQLEKNIIDVHALNQATYLDNLTGIPNRYSCDLIFDKYSSAGDIGNLGCALISISNLEEINQMLGRETGNKILQDFSHIFEKFGDTYGFVGRNSGNEFLAVLEDCSPPLINEFLDDLQLELDKYNQSSDQIPILLSCHYILNTEAGVSEFADLITLLYKEAKRG
ncbi:MAG TPA: GGDEF domain-containing protein [Lachnospiraceae bacterium]|nr:GGDEF domain-containing protein [Lachnospiraceae bacterium]